MMNTKISNAQKQAIQENAKKIMDILLDSTMEHCKGKNDAAQFLMINLEFFTKIYFESLQHVIDAGLVQVLKRAYIASLSGTIDKFMDNLDQELQNAIQH